ncbi:LexA family protein [Klebsiella pneumoniae]|uniref:LexA family protein n=1 Tax=Klebsiella pneumoniae TaxID=573 RepID=UPI002E1864B8|nr:S24 family peptidase [Klebsiella pneumoniae]
MKFDDSFPGRVAIARSAIGMTQDELAQKVGVVRRQIAAYEGGEARPREKALQNLAAALGTTTEWLAQGKGSGPDVSSVKRTVTVREIPVLTHVQARFESLDDLLKTASIKDFIPAPQGANEYCFAVEIQGDSMSSGEGISFPPGTIVTFDSSLEAVSGDFVMCVLNDDSDATFKQLILDQHQIYLKPLNRLYPMFQPDFIEIVGVAIHSQFRINRDKLTPPMSHSEVEKLVEEAHAVSHDFWSNSKFDQNTPFDERLKRLDEIAERLEKYANYSLSQGRYKNSNDKD